MYTLPELFRLISSFNILSALKQEPSFSFPPPPPREHGSEAVQSFWNVKCGGGHVSLKGWWWAADILLFCFYGWKYIKSTTCLNLIMIPWASVLLIDGSGIQVHTQYPFVLSSARQELLKQNILWLFLSSVFILSQNKRCGCCIRMQEQIENQPFCATKSYFKCYVEYLHGSINFYSPFYANLLCYFVHQKKDAFARQPQWATWCAEDPCYCSNPSPGSMQQRASTQPSGMLMAHCVSGTVPDKPFLRFAEVPSQTYLCDTVLHT